VLPNERTLSEDIEKQAGVSVYELDICDAGGVNQLLESLTPDAIIHLAGISFVPEAEQDYARTLKVNVLGTEHLLRALDAVCQKIKKPGKFLFVSSGDVYGAARASDLPLQESLEPAPRNLYALSKLQSETLVEMYARRSPQLSALIFRSFNHIGPGQNDRFVVSNFARQLAAISLGQAPAVLKVGNLEARRDFCDVRDVVRAYVMGLTQGSGVVNIASGNAVSIQEIVDTLVAISGVQLRIEPDHERMRPSDTPELRGSNIRAYETLGWKPEKSLADSLRDIYQDWIARLRKAG
jgi:GDP-4-dehydro-6-deoxy-D-mannose reductase